MIVLGLGGFMHDYNCALVDTESQQVVLREAERLSRKKHHPPRSGDDDLLFPVEHACDELSISPGDIDVVAFGHEDPFGVKDTLKDQLPVDEFVDVDHHQSHAAGGFFVSPFSSALVVSLDGFGDGASGLVATGRDNQLKELVRIDDEDSLGLEYLRATFHIGLGGYGSEGKTQGLAAYGEPTYYDEYTKEISITDDGNIELSQRLKSDLSKLTREGGYLNTELLSNAFLHDQCRRRIPPEPLTDEHKNLAASIQKVLEEVVLDLCRFHREETGMDNLVLTGGVAMNSSLNGRLLREGEFERVFPLPMASDRGVGLGAALHVIHNDEGHERFFQLRDVFHGQSFTDEQIEASLANSTDIDYKRTDDVFDEAVESLAGGDVIGWFQGASEVGARALGHRSILASPAEESMKDTINEKVKHRESFRPFAPSILEEYAGEYFEIPRDGGDLSFMTFVVPARQRATDEAPAVVHADQTARIQTVDEARFPRYHRLISAFYEKTGVPTVLNTSFNDSGDPIVETPEDAINTFLKTGMDRLFLGNYVVDKT